MRSNRRLSRRVDQLEALESRVLLSGLTIITHGAEFLSTARPSWIDYMATAIRARVGPSTSIYALRMEPNSSGQIVATGMARLAGPAPTSNSSTNDETILLLDWAAASGVDLLGLSSNYSVTTVATAVMPYLTTAFPSIGLTAPLVEGSIQMIGHSRGAPLVSELARMLGQQGIWVDQLTTLDSVPVPPDPSVTLKSNIIFADNYYQHSGDGFLTPNGAVISGAYNVGPLKLGGAYGTLDGTTHGDVHLFYQGTINTALNASDGSKTVVNSWYSGNSLGRGLTGFYFSRLGGGSDARPTSGIGTAFGGTGTRSAITNHVGAQWGNIATITVSGDHIGQGSDFSATYRYNSFSTAAAITWYLDPDTNPYNGNSIAITDSDSVAGTGDSPVMATANFTQNVDGGVYYLEGQITNTTGTRYEYSGALTVGNLPPTGTINTATPTTITGWADDPDTPDAAVTIQAQSDGVTFFTGPANLDRPDLTQLSSTAHGFSIDLTALPPGSHKIDIYAMDTTATTSKLIGTKIINTNVLPSGHIDSFDGATFTGWAMDPNTGIAPSQIMYKIDGGIPWFATADASRPDLTNASAHGFSVTLPQLKAGAHTITVYAVDSTSSKLVLLGSKTATVKNPLDNLLPKGSITSATPLKIAGTANDPTAPKAAIFVRVDVDGVAGTPFLTATNHKFTQVLSLTPGEHKLDLYAVDSTSGTPVFLGRKIVGASSAKGGFDVATAAGLTGWAYSAALGSSGATIRIDVDSFLGTTFVTNITHTVPKIVPLTSGPFGFSTAIAGVAAGKHTVRLEYLDPLTLTVTTLATKTVTTI
ncbi:MAG TPA: hypothetical protein VGN88_02115 [Phycisphaerae bacterium]